MPGEFFLTGGVMHQSRRHAWQPGWWLIKMERQGDEKDAIRFENRRALLTAWEMKGEPWWPYRLMENYAWARWKEDNQRKE